MSWADEIAIRLSREEVELLIEALDSHEYWQLGDVLPRKSGMVFVPGDALPDIFWGGDEPTPEQAVAIEQIRSCRRLGERLSTALSEG